MEVQYVTNAKGKKTGVLLSMKDWKELLSNPDILQMLHDLRQAFYEVKEIEAGRMKGYTWEEVKAEL